MPQPNEPEDFEINAFVQASGVGYDVARPLLACVWHGLPANIALMQICMNAIDAEEVKFSIHEANMVLGDDIPPLAELRALWDATPDAYGLVKGILETVDHAGTASPDSFAAAFDRAAALSPEASVALYSLGSPALLAEATTEIVEKMREWGLLGGDKTALEIGCGNGRFLKALAPSLQAITGIDISAAMIAAARARCRDLANVEVRQTEGRDLTQFADTSFDLVLAADSFPYIERCGPELVAKHFAESARVLKPGGCFLLFNYAYEVDLADQQTVVAQLAHETSLTPLRNGTRDFRLWDGVSFLLGKASV